MMPVSWTFQHPWEDFFTVVQWDQRGAGKTLSSAGQKPGEKMTIDQMQADAEQVIEWLQHTYGKKKIFLLGHSWGSILGLRIAQHHPEWLYAYIGAGQVVNARRGEVVSYQETLARAEATGNTGAVQELKAMAPYPGPDPLPLDRIFGERQWVAALGGMMYGKTDADETKIRALSPDYTDKDVESAALGEMSSVQVLLPQMAAVNFDTVTDFKCPVFFFAGAQDRTVPTSVLVDYYGKIKAPKKGLFVVERAAHFVVSESPGEVLMHLVNDVRPLSQ
jgi:pimeloyl-ACP methyl ester carboxylesterase